MVPATKTTEKTILKLEFIARRNPGELTRKAEKLYSYEINIVCDNWQGRCPNNCACQTSEPVASAKIGKTEISAMALELGWLIKNGKHYCPDCATKMT